MHPEGVRERIPAALQAAGGWRVALFPGFRLGWVLRPFRPPYRPSSRWTRMKWSVNAVWAVGISILGMWQPMQPRSG